MFHLRNIFRLISFLRSSWFLMCWCTHQQQLKEQHMADVTVMNELWTDLWPVSFLVGKGFSSSNTLTSLFLILPSLQSQLFCTLLLIISFSKCIFSLDVFFLTYSPYSSVILSYSMSSLFLLELGFSFPLLCRDLINSSVAVTSMRCQAS